MTDRSPSAGASEDIGTGDIDTPDPDAETETDDIGTGDAETETETEHADADTHDEDAETDHADTEHADTEARPWSWHVTRASGLVLAVLLVVQFVVSFVVNDVGKTTAGSMTTRWNNTTWRAFEWIVLTLALVHAAVALHRRVLAGDRPANTKVALDSTIVGGAIVVIGTLTVVVLTLR